MFSILGKWIVCFSQIAFGQVAFFPRAPSRGACSTRPRVPGGVRELAVREKKATCPIAGCLKTHSTSLVLLWYSCSRSYVTTLYVDNASLRRVWSRCGVLKLRPYAEFVGVVAC